MAFASSRIGAQEAIIKPCDLCEDEDDVNWFCVDCIQNLCERCKKGHLKIAICRSHRLVPILQGVVIQKTNVSNLCREHKEPFSFFCRTCEENICSMCLSMVHKKHDFTDLRNLHLELQSRLENFIKEKEDEQMNIVKDINDMDECTSQYRDVLSENYATIDNRMKAIHEAVDEEGNKLKISMKHTTAKHIKEVEERKQKLRGLRNEYDETIQTVKRELTLQTTSTLSKFVITSTTKLQSLRSMTFSINKDIKFIADRTSHGLIGEMIGKNEGRLEIREFHEEGNLVKISTISELSIIKQHTLDELNDCRKICVSPDGSVWFGSRKYVYKLSSDYSRVLVKITNICVTYGIFMPCEYIVCLPSGDVFASFFDIITIMYKITPTKSYRFKQLTEISIRAIAVTNYDEVVVGIAEKAFLPISSLVKYSNRGTLLSRMILDRDVTGFCINNDGNCIVSDERSRCLATLDWKGNVLNEIQISEPYLCRMICDRYGNILGLSRDINDKFVYLISDDEEVERYFTVNCDNYINDICIDSNNRLLILVDGKKVIVAEYLERNCQD